MATTSAHGKRAKRARAAWCSSAAICRKRRSARDLRAARPDLLIPPPTAEGPRWSRMTDTQSIPSVTDRVRPVAAGGPVVAAHFLGQTAVFALGEETLLFVAPDGAEQRVAAHAGGILAVACDGARVLTGGDDGKLVATNAKGESETLAIDARH